ncbi:unnamed protein product [Effrenium voratum]|uniref:Uncharacterized protein n=1 Tax=Effrenium voratum TaxID=2562239 RepID=A0AA36IWN2_9DINO|nr:unnamed protein product [Effrenium voratum]
MYGFEAGPKGVFDMLEQFDRPEFAMNTAFQEQGAALNHLLFVDAEPEADADHSDKPRQKDVEVVIRHAVQEGLRSEEARLFLKSNATMKEVREALAEQLKLPASSCRLVERVGASGAFASFRDSERIQGRRALLVMGVESLKAPEEREMEQREEERQKGKEIENEERSEQERRFAAETPLKRQALALQAPRKVRQLTLQEALALQRDLIQGFSKPEFQARKADLERRLKTNDPKNFSLERQALFLTVQRAVLPKYSLEGSARGVFDMMQQFVGGEFDYDPEFQRQGSILTGLLFSEDAAPEAKSSKKAKPSEPVLDVEVVVRHAVEEVRARRNARSAKDGPLRLGKAFPVRGALFCGLEK